MKWSRNRLICFSGYLLVFNMAVVMGINFFVGFQHDYRVTVFFNSVGEGPFELVLILVSLSLGVIGLFSLFKIKEDVIRL
jgi:hypothetical protein